jgi:FdhE protein
VTVEQIGEPAQAVPLRLHDPALLFEGRAGRLAKLAEASPTPEYLLLLSRVAAGQRSAVRDVPVLPARAPSASGDGPPLRAERVPRDGSWRRMLGVVLSTAKAPGLPIETQDALRRLSDSGVSHLESLAEAVLAGNVPPDRVACAPFVGAALQAWFGALASRLDPATVPAGSAACPACGSPPVASVVQAADRLRYLSCSLCAAEWNFPRLHCIVCRKDDELAYYGIEGDPGVKAEACGRCRVYVKLFDLEKRAGAEAAADDVATIALDVMLAEEGWRRAAMNLYLIAAGSEPPSA